MLGPDINSLLAMHLHQQCLISFNVKSPSLPKTCVTTPHLEDQLRLSPAITLINNPGSYLPKSKHEFNHPSNSYTLEALCMEELGWDAECWKQVEVSRKHGDRK